MECEGGGSGAARRERFEGGGLGIHLCVIYMIFDHVPHDQIIERFALMLQVLVAPVCVGMKSDLFLIDVESSQVKGS